MSSGQQFEKKHKQNDKGGWAKRSVFGFTKKILALLRFIKGFYSDHSRKFILRRLRGCISRGLSYVDEVNRFRKYRLLMESRSEERVVASDSQWLKDNPIFEKGSRDENFGILKYIFGEDDFEIPSQGGILSQGTNERKFMEDQDYGKIKKKIKSESSITAFDFIGMPYIYFDEQKLVLSGDVEQNPGPKIHSKYGNLSDDEDDFVPSEQWIREWETSPVRADLNIQVRRFDFTQHMNGAISVESTVQNQMLRTISESYRYREERKEQGAAVDSVENQLRCVCDELYYYKQWGDGWLCNCPGIVSPPIGSFSPQIKNRELVVRTEEDENQDDWIYQDKKESENNEAEVKEKY